MPELKELTPQAAKFIDTLVALQGGDVLNQIGDRIQALIRAVIDTNKGNKSSKGGKVTITFSVTPFRPGDAAVVVVDATVTEKFPLPRLGGSPFYTTEDGNLSQTNTKQLALSIIDAQAGVANG